LTVRKSRSRSILGLTTVLAVIFALLAPAAIAAPPTGLTLTPPSDSIPAGNCNAFTVHLTGATQTDITGQTIDVEVRDSDSGQTNDANTPVFFCTPPASGGAYNQNGPNPQDVDTDENTNLNFDDACETGGFFAGPANYQPGCNGTISGETGLTDTNGELTFGIISYDPGTYVVTAYFDTDESDTLDTGEPFDASAKTFTQAQFQPQCSDQADNDGDGLIDNGSDPGCTSATDNDETDPNTGPNANQCEDGFDNDGDGKIDFGEDGGCTSRTDNDETGTGNKRPATSITIRYNKRPHAFKGTISNNFKRCRINRVVLLKRKRPGKDPVVKRTRSTDKGTYHMKKRRVHHKTWYTVAKPKQFARPNGGTVFCLKGRSVNYVL